MRARPVYWLMLALVAGGSVGLRALASKLAAQDDWQPAVYRYPADGMPGCADLTGHVASRLPAQGRWSRMRLPDDVRRSAQGCLLAEPMPT